MGGTLVNAGGVLELLLCVRVVSVHARLSVGQPGAVCNCRSVALHGFAARVCFRSAAPDALEDH